MSEPEFTLADVDFEDLFRAVKRLLAAGMSEEEITEFVNDALGRAKRKS